MRNSLLQSLEEGLKKVASISDKAIVYSISSEKEVGVVPDEEG
jgi:hypothetical protein